MPGVQDQAQASAGYSGGELLMWSTRLKTDEERRLEPDGPKVVATCDECGCQIESGQIYGVDLFGNNICRDCLNKVWDSTSDDEAFDKLGYRVVT